ncbi:MAG: hypothetical protein E7326_09325 [Clostridiales bacterium]|nr:hypothetical protein [Clostridiales bacterium]
MWGRQITEEQGVPFIRSLSLQFLFLFLFLFQFPFLFLFLFLFLLPANAGNWMQMHAFADMGCTFCIFLKGKRGFIPLSRKEETGIIHR